MLFVLLERTVRVFVVVLVVNTVMLVIDMRICGMDEWGDCNNGCVFLQVF